MQMNLTTGGEKVKVKERGAGGFATAVQGAGNTFFSRVRAIRTFDPDIFMYHDRTNLHPGSGW
jgi:hypothetical protein